MSSIIYNGHEIQDLIVNGNQAQLWLNGQKLYPSGEEPSPVDPYNPLGLTPFTIRVKFQSGYTPDMGDSQTLVDAQENVWDITRNNTDWTGLFSSNNNLVSVLGANSTDVTKMVRLFYRCSSLNEVPLFDTHSVTDFTSMFEGWFSGFSPIITNIPLFDTSSAISVSGMFEYCTLVQSGALALYQQMSTQVTPPINYFNTFKDCGRDTVTGAAELAQIPSSWGGTGA